MAGILLSPQAGALIHVYTDGSVLLTHGGTEMGQGIHTKMVQVSGLWIVVSVQGRCWEKLRDGLSREQNQA